MGDSFVSGPGITPEQEDSGVCLRSERNWPAELADLLDLDDVRDVSCAGASTRHLLNDVPVEGGVVKAQVASLGPQVDLVTVGIGANNAKGILGGLVGACTTETRPSPSACRDYVESTLPQLLDEQVRPQVVSALREVRRRAPEAAVLLTGYLRIASEGAGCDDLGIARGDLSSFVAGEEAIDEALAEAAEEAGVQYLDLRALSDGHDVCSTAPWVNGRGLEPGDGELLHPNAAGMRAVADAAADTLRPGQA